MSWHYQDTMIDDVSKVRFYVGDTDTTDQLLTDEEITFALSEGGSVRAAASLCADRLAAQYARLADLKEGQLSISYSQRFEQMRAVSESITDSATLSDPATPSAGGIFVADKTATEADTSLVRPSFSVDMLDSELVGSLDVTRSTRSEETD